MKSSYFLPKELVTYYHGDFEEGLEGERRKIVILSFGGVFDTTDLQTYWDRVLGDNIIRPNVHHVFATNNPILGRIDYDQENTFNIQIMGGVCPNSDIYLMTCHNSKAGLKRGIDYAIDLDPLVINISWGVSESAWTSIDVRHIDESLQAAYEKGIVVCCASGDRGMFNGTPSTQNVLFPASSPHVLSVGATTICSMQNTIEIPWSSTKRDWGTGGGHSVFFEASDAQKKHGMTRRGVPDLAACGDPRKGILGFFRGQWRSAGGTSVSAPLVGAMLCLTGDRKYGLLESMYNHYPDGFRITRFESQHGWNTRTGLGILSMSSVA